MIVAMTLSCWQLEARDDPKQSHDRQEWEIGVPRYVAGGVVGSTLGVGLPIARIIMLATVGYQRSKFSWSVLGSGLGHAIQGRWWDGPGWGLTMGGYYTYLALAATVEENSRALAWTLFLGTKLAELITVWLPPYRSTPVPKELDTSRYVAGGVLGTVYGFGIGHLVQGRGIASAWPYTLTQVTALSLFFTERKCRIRCGMIDFNKVAGFMLMAVSKLMETISLWGISAINYQLISTTDKSSPKFTLIPLFYNRQLSLRLTMTL